MWHEIMILDKPILRNVLSTFCNSSGSKILVNSFLQNPSSTASLVT